MGEDGSTGPCNKTSCSAPLRKKTPASSGCRALLESAANKPAEMKTQTSRAPQGTCPANTPTSNPASSAPLPSSPLVDQTKKLWLGLMVIVLFLEINAGQRCRNVRQGSREVLDSVLASLPICSLVLTSHKWKRKRHLI